MVVHTSARGYVQSRNGLLVGGLLVLAGLGIIAFLADDAEATHFRGGTLQTSLVSSTPRPLPPTELVTVSLTGEIAWRMTAFFPPCGATVGDVFGPEGTFTWGDASSAAGYAWEVIEADCAANMVFAKFIETATGGDMTHNYPPSLGGPPYVIQWSSCCRLSDPPTDDHINNGDDGEALTAYTEVDIGGANHSPIVNPFVVIQDCPYPALCKFKIMGSDPDGDELLYRFATADEAGDATFVQPGPPHAPLASAIDPVTGWVTWDTTGATISGGAYTYYSMALMVEDETTMIPVDFFIRFVPPPPPPPPSTDIIAGFGFTMAEGCGHTIVAFTDGSKASSIDGDYFEIDSWSWDFGDSGTSTEQNPTHKYNSPGKYKVSLTVTDTNGQIGTTTKEIEVEIQECPIPETTAGSTPEDPDNPRDGSDATMAEFDADGDGVDDAADLCPYVADPGQVDTDGDAFGDACDDDDDSDRIADGRDSCMLTANSDQSDLDGDAIGDACDDDVDGDGIVNGTDNCVWTVNALQTDMDKDTVGDACQGGEMLVGGAKAGTPAVRDSSRVASPVEPPATANVAMWAALVLGAAIALMAVVAGFTRRQQ